MNIDLPIIRCPARLTGNVCRKWPEHRARFCVYLVLSLTLLLLVLLPPIARAEPYLPSQTANSVVDFTLQQVLEDDSAPINQDPSAILAVAIDLQNSPIDLPKTTYNIGYIVGIEGQPVLYTLNGKSVSYDQLQTFQEMIELEQQHNRAVRDHIYADQRRDTFRRLVHLNQWTDPLEVDNADVISSGRVALNLTRTEIDFLIANSETLVSRIYLYPVDGLTRLHTSYDEINGINDLFYDNSATAITITSSGKLFPLSGRIAIGNISLVFLTIIWLCCQIRWICPQHRRLS